MKCASSPTTRRETLRSERLTFRLLLAACLGAATTGCARDAIGPVEVATLLPAASTRSITAQCPASPDFVVSTEAALRDAVATAPPGSTIAIDGMIALSTGPIVITRSDLRLTCAAPGAGLEILPGSPTGRLIRIHAPRVAVSGLRLAGHLAVASAVHVESRGGVLAVDVSITDNDMLCSTSPCVFLIGTPRAVIARNHMARNAGVTGGGSMVLAWSVTGATADSVTLADNDIACGPLACAYFDGTPHAMILRNRMAPAEGAESGTMVHVQSTEGLPTSKNVTLADNDLTCGVHNCVYFAGAPGAVIARNRMAPRVGGSTSHGIVVQRLGTTASADVTLADNIITCGTSTCAWFLGTPRAMIVRNRMAIAEGVANVHSITVQRVVESGTNREYGAEDVTVADNDIVCGTGSCVFSVGTPRALITRNRLTATASGSGIHVQGSQAAGTAGSTDGTRVEQNTVTATAPSTNGLFGAIRVRDGSGIVVADNIVTGPWQNSLIITAVLGGEVTRNDLRGAIRFGILFGSNNIPAVRPLVDGLAVRNNRVTGAGGGAGVQFSCRNVFVGNNLNGNSVGAEFFAESGANTLVGNGTTVVDDGAMDCDGDGTVDPNVITGAKRAQKGLPLGPVIGRAVSGAMSDMR